MEDLISLEMMFPPKLPLFKALMMSLEAILCLSVIV